MAPRGRPRTFDREQALRSAMEVFWARGYDGATLEELQAAMGGIAPPSFYAAFGSKDRLFREAVDLYRDDHGRARCCGALDAPTAREGDRGLLRAATEQFCSGDGPRGCLIVLGALNCTRANKDAHDHLQPSASRAPKIIRAAPRARRRRRRPARRRAGRRYGVVLHHRAARPGRARPRRRVAPGADGRRRCRDGRMGSARRQEAALGRPQIVVRSAPVATPEVGVASGRQAFRSDQSLVGPIA